MAVRCQCFCCCLLLLPLLLLECLPAAAATAALSPGRRLWACFKPYASKSGEEGGEGPPSKSEEDDAPHNSHGELEPDSALA